MAHKLNQAELDNQLSVAAEDPERFTEVARDLAATMEGVELEIREPLAWRKETNRTAEGTSSRSVEEQFRDEVDKIIQMDREEEGRLARRIEFARFRLEIALESAGLSMEDLEQGKVPAGGCANDCGSLPTEVCHRWRELHALRTEMVERNLYLVLINVERYAHTRASRLDLIQEGASGLFRAVDGFDWRRGLLFRTYAVHWLNQAFRSYLYNFGHTVRVPVYLQKAMKHVHDAIERLGDPNASVEDIAVEAGLGEKLVAAALKASRSTFSMDLALGDEGDGMNLRDTLGVESEDGPYSTDLEDISLSEGLEEALERLNERERFVVSMRFGIGTDHEHTLAEVAAELGVSLERVRQIQVRALSKMDTPNLRKAIDPFLF